MKAEAVEFSRFRFHIADENGVKNDGSDQMVVAFTITDINYLVVGLLWDILRPLSYLCLSCLVLWLR